MHENLNLKLKNVRFTLWFANILTQKTDAFQLLNLLWKNLWYFKKDNVEWFLSQHLILHAHL
jgi:hypothetical protein